MAAALGDSGPVFSHLSRNGLVSFTQPLAQITAMRACPLTVSLATSSAPPFSHYLGKSGGRFMAYISKPHLPPSPTYPPSTLRV